MTFIDQSWYQRPAHPRLRTSAGGVVVRLGEHGRPLVALTREHDYTLFILPKGGVEPGETIEAAARREIEEEAGLSDLRLEQALGERSRLDFDKKVWITTHYFLFTTGQIDGTPSDAHHQYGLAWFPLDALPDMLWPEQAELIQSSRAAILRALNLPGS